MISLVATFPLWKPPPIQDKVNLIREFSSVCGEVLVLHMDDRFRLLVSPAITLLLLLLSVELVTGRILIRLPFRTGQSETKTRGGGDLATSVCCARGDTFNHSRLNGNLARGHFAQASTLLNKTISLPQPRPLFSSISFIQLASQDGDLQSVNFFGEAIIFGHVLSSIGE